MVLIARLRFTARRFVLLVVLERTSRVEHPLEEPLLPFEDRRIRGPLLQRLRQLPRLACQLRGFPRGVGIPHVIELARHIALCAREVLGQGLPLGCHLLPLLLLLQGVLEETLHLPVERSLLPRQLLQLRQQLRQATRGLRIPRALTIARQGSGRLPQCVGGVGHRPARLGDAALIRRVLDGLRHLLLGVGHRFLRLGGDERRALGLAVQAIGGLLHALGSEERRVGKECRSRWSPYH